MADEQADQQADQDGKVLPWTIKGIPPEARNAAIAAAKRERQTLGEWIARAIRAQVQADRNQGRAPAVVGPVVQPSVDLSEIERTVALIRELADSGAPPPKAVSRIAYGLLRGRLEGLRGPTKAASGRTRGGAGPTDAEESQTDTQDGPTSAANGQTIDENSPTPSS